MNWSNQFPSGACSVLSLQFLWACRLACVYSNAVSGFLPLKLHGLDHSNLLLHCCSTKLQRRAPVKKTWVLCGPAWHSTAQYNAIHCTSGGWSCAGSHAEASCVRWGSKIKGNMKKWLSMLIGWYLHWLQKPLTLVSNHTCIKWVWHSASTVSSVYTAICAGEVWYTSECLLQLK